MKVCFEVKENFWGLGCTNGKMEGWSRVRLLLAKLVRVKMKLSQDRRTFDRAVYRPVLEEGILHAMIKVEGALGPDSALKVC